jgi:hypothetical protein
MLAELWLLVSTKQLALTQAASLLLLIISNRYQLTGFCPVGETYYPSAVLIAGGFFIEILLGVSGLVTISPYGDDVEIACGLCALNG